MEATYKFGLLFAVASLLSVSCSQFSAQSKGLQPEVATGGRRVALVIGNKDYPWKPLANPVNDATDVAAALLHDGFASADIHLVVNAKEREMKRAVREFIESVKPGDFAFVYYSGHGVEVKGANYLLPIDIAGDATEGEVEDEAVSAQRVLRDLGTQGAAVKVLVLDACRDNPLRATRSAGGGLAPMEGLGSLVVFSTEAGRTASDNTMGRNGLFTQYLLKALTMKGVSLDDAIRTVARQMAKETERRQVPAIYGLLEQPVFLVAGPAPEARAAIDPAEEAWEKIKDSKTPEDFDDFRTHFPASPFSEEAAMMAAHLRRETAKNAPAENHSAAAAPANPATAVVDDAPTWTDPATGLIWTKKDSGDNRDMNQHDAADYCKKLKLADYKDWRLPAIEELEALYDPNQSQHVDCCGNVGGYHFDIHIKGNLQLTGWCWSGTPTGAPGQAWSFGFNQGKRNAIHERYSIRASRALCVRKP